MLCVQLMQKIPLLYLGFPKLSLGSDKSWCQLITLYKQEKKKKKKEVAIVWFKLKGEWIVFHALYWIKLLKVTFKYSLWILYL